MRSTVPSNIMRSAQTSSTISAVCPLVHRATSVKCRGAGFNPTSFEAKPQAKVAVHSSSVSTIVSTGSNAVIAPSKSETRRPTTLLKLAFGTCNLPHPSKAHYGGEDAWFVAEVDGGACGVADGVGGWAEDGVNPADYSRMLMSVANDYVQRTGRFADETAFSKHNSVMPIKAQAAIAAAHAATRVAGSATAVVITVDAASGTLQAANLGDSGFMVVRNGRSVLRTRALQHYFDCPLQLGAFPEFVEATDTAEQADIFNFQLQAGDVIIAGTDGLWDNMFDDEIVSMVNAHASQGSQVVADRLGKAARVHAEDKEFSSPYMKEAIAQGYNLPWWEQVMGARIANGRLSLKQPTGGKLDDITVIVAVTTPTPAPMEATEQSVSMVSDVLASEDSVQRLERAVTAPSADVSMDEPSSAPSV